MDRAVVWIGVLTAACVVVAGCAAGSTSRATVLTTDAFASPSSDVGAARRDARRPDEKHGQEASAAGSGVPSPPMRIGREEPRVLTLTPAEAAGVPLDEVRVEDRPAGEEREGAGPVRASRLAEPELVDEFVGEMNGRPLFASEFLAPMGAQMRAEAERMTREEWLEAQFGLILRELYRQLDNDLVVADALADLPPEQREPGLRRMRDELQQKWISENRGSRQIAERRLRDEEGLTPEEYMEAEREKLLVQSEFGQEIRRRVQLTARDVKLEYRRRHEEYNPTPVARLRRIRVLASNEEGIERVERGLASRPFEEVAAERPNTANREEGGLLEVAFDGPYEEATFFRSPEELNEAAQALEPGEWTGPIEVGAWAYWLKLEEIVAPKMPLYDAQLSLANAIMGRERRIKENEYKLRLRQQAGVTDEMMVTLAGDLLEIAEDWYHVESREN